MLRKHVTCRMLLLPVIELTYINLNKIAACHSNIGRCSTWICSVLAVQAL